MGCIMKKTHSSICLPNQHSYKIGESLKVTVQVEENDFQLPVDSLFEMAARINKKRAFLFVSKVLGKHIPLHPNLPLVASGLLAILYYEGKQNKKVENKGLLMEAVKEQTPEKLKTAFETLKEMNLSLDSSTLFIGFAETATALGHGVFERFTNASYIHSTREYLLHKETTINFEEEHSHATAQRCYATENYFQHDNPVCLVDDEITTGKTTLNIIESIQRKYPRKEYSILSLLDWRKEEDVERFKRFEAEWGIKINCYSLLKGTVSVEGEASLPEEWENDGRVLPKRQSKIQYNTCSFSDFQQKHTSIDSKGNINTAPYLRFTGRFGIRSEENERINSYCEKIGTQLRSLRKGGKTLCLGTGEFMHIPLKVSAAMGEDVYFHSTTRSPVIPYDYEGYAVKNRLQFSSPDDPEIMNYVYNVLGQGYEEIFLFFERRVEEKRLQSLLQQLSSIATIHIVYFS
jgi:hypothetical protein